MCPQSEDVPPEQESIYEHLSHRLLTLLDPFRAAGTRQAALRWLAALTVEQLHALAVDPHWAAVRTTLSQADDRWLAHLDVDDPEPWQDSGSSPASDEASVGRDDAQGDGRTGAPDAARDAVRRAPATIALYVSDLRELLADDYHTMPFVAPLAADRARAPACGRTCDAPCPSCTGNGAESAYASLFATAEGRSCRPRAHERFARALPWALTNHATWLTDLADRFPARPDVWRAYLSECLAYPVERSVPTRLARAARTLCRDRPAWQGLVDRVVVTADSAVARLPPLELLPDAALPDAVLGVRAEVARLLSDVEVTAPPLVCLAELLGLVRVLRHASAVDVRVAWQLGGQDPDATLRVLRERTDAAELVFESVLTAALQQPTAQRLRDVVGQRGADALRFTRSRFAALRAATGQLGILEASEREP